MNVSIPQIAVSPGPVPASVSSPAPSGQFSAALSQATQDAQNTSSTPSVSSKSGNSGRATTGTKDNAKSNAKSSSASQNPTSAIAQLPNLPTDNSVKIPNNTLFSAFVAPQPMQMSTEADATTSSDNSSAGSKSDPVAAMTAGARSNFSHLLKSLPAQTDASAQKLTAEAPTQPSPSSSGKSVSELANTLPEKSSPENEKVSIEQNAKTISANAAAATPAKLPMPESKSASRDSAESNSSQKTAGSSSASHHASAGDVQQTPTAPLPQVPLPEIKSGPAPTAQANAASPVKTNSDAVPSASGTPKKDGDSAQNAASQSQKNDSSALQGATIKAASSTSQAQPAGVSTPNSNSSSQVSPVLADVKAATASATPKANEAVVKNQIPTPAAEAEPTAAAPIVSPIQVAKLVEQAGQTELHVGIQAGEFGSVDIRTSMAHSQFTAEISVERGELGRAMSAELPALHDRLAEQRVPAANIILQDNSYSGHGSSGFQQGARQNQYAAQNQGAFAENAEAISPVVAMESLESSTGLDIHI